MTRLSINNLILPEPLPGKTGWPWAGSSDSNPGKGVISSSWPKISVVMPSYNQSQFIEEAIRSVLMQKYPDLEFIIIDGGSTDNTLEIINKYAPWITYWVSEPDDGQGQAINKGIQKAIGDILFWLNSDDLVLPGAFEIVAKEFMMNPETQIVVGQAKQIDGTGKIIGDLRSYFIDWEELATNPRNSIRQISTFFSRDLFEKYGYINEKLYIAMDNELMVRLTRFVKPVVVDSYLTAYRSYPGTKTSYQLMLGYEETDKYRLSLLVDKKKRLKYKQRSSANWLSLFENDLYSRQKRVLCLGRALKIYPAVIFNRRFWASIKEFLAAKEKNRK